MDHIFARKPLPFRRVENMAIAHIGERRIFFNHSATRVWELVDGRRTVGDIARALIAAPNPSPAQPARVIASVDHLLQTLCHLHVLEQVTPDGAGQAGAHATALASRSQNATSLGDASGKVQTGQDACATPRKKGALSVRSHNASHSSAAQPIEERLNDVYWNNCYIQKMHLELTYRCNFRCIQCYNTTHASTDGELTVTEWRSVLEQLAALGCHSVTFTGGEVFVRRDVVDILQAACDNAFSFRINTNGSLITEVLLQKLEPMRPFIQAFDVSFYGGTPLTHDTLARRLGAYDATLRAVRLLAEARMPILTKFVTMKDNFGGLSKWKRDMAALGVKYTVAASPLIPRTDRNAAPLTQLLTDEQYQELLSVQRFEEDSGAHFCRPGHIRGAITPNGFVSPCEWLTDYKLGHLKSHSLRDIWYSPESLAFRRIFETEAECPSCALRPGCLSCPARSYLETGNLLKCAPSPRHFAEIYQQSQVAHG